MKVVPELLCTDIDATTAFYVDVLGFEVKFERPDEKFVCFTRDGVELMSEQLSGPGRHWITGEMATPFGRGINLQWDVDDAAALYQRVCAVRPDCIYMAIEERTYQRRDDAVRQTQFIVQDPDGYLFRFCSSSG